MKKNLSKTAFTLIELIIATALVVIVLLGMFSINSVLSNNSQDYGQRYLVKSGTQITLNHILNNAGLAVGSANANDEGILIGGAANGPADPNTFCIHQASQSVQGAQNLIGFNTGDIWVCYSWSANQINWCAERYNGSVGDPRGATSCTAAIAAGTVIPNPTTGSNQTFLGSANTGFANLPPTFTSDGVQLLFTITLQNCLNNSAASCNGNGANPGSTPGVSSDPVNNPEVVVSGSASPSQESM